MRVWPKLRNTACVPIAQDLAQEEQVIKFIDKTLKPALQDLKDSINRVLCYLSAPSVQARTLISTASSDMRRDFGEFMARRNEQVRPLQVILLNDMLQQVNAHNYDVEELFKQAITHVFENKFSYSAPIQRLLSEEDTNTPEKLAAMLLNPGGGMTKNKFQISLDELKQDTDLFKLQISSIASSLRLG